MSKGKTNPLDELITALSNEFAKIPNFHQTIQDPDIFKAHIFMATRIMQLHSTKDLIIRSFLPAVQTDIIKTNQNINTSIYKEILKGIDYDVDDIKYETIRLGYVLTFHKYENFIKDFICLWENLSINVTNESNQTFEQYLKYKFGLNLKAWHEFPSIHMFSFISNCTKHSDGKCRLDNPNHNKPFYFSYANDNELIKPSINDFKEDFKRLIKSTEIMIQILGNCNLLRIIESDKYATYEFDGVNHPLYSAENIAEKQPEIDKLIEAIKNIIDIYKQV